MTLSPIFMFAPVPLSDRSPLAHAAALAHDRAEAQAPSSTGRRRNLVAQAEKPAFKHLTAASVMALVL